MLKQNLEKHKIICPKAEVECPQKCGEKILRENKAYHVANDCKMVQMHCPYKDCTIRGNRKIIAAHVFSKNGFIEH